MFSKIDPVLMNPFSLNGIGQKRVTPWGVIASKRMWLRYPIDDASEIVWFNKNKERYITIEGQMEWSTVLWPIVRFIKKERGFTLFPILLLVLSWSGIIENNKNKLWGPARFWPVNVDVLWKSIWLISCDEIYDHLSLIFGKCMPHLQGRLHSSLYHNCLDYDKNWLMF